MNEKTKIWYRAIGHTVLLLTAACGVYYFVNELLLEKNSWNENYLAVSSFLCLVIVGYSLLRRKVLFTSLWSTLFSLACFVISALLLLLSDFYVNLPLWVAGGILAAALIDQHLGMLYLYFFAFQAIFLQGSAFNGLVLHFLVATAVCLVIPKMKTWLSMLYVMVFSSSLVIILTLVMNRMDFEQKMLLDSFGILGVYLGCILLAMLLRLFRNAEKEEPGAPDSVELDVDKLLAPMNAAEEVSAENLKRAVEKAVQPAEEYKEEVSEAVPDYTPYCNEKSELLLKLKEKSKTVYAHSRLIGQIAGEAAEKIHADTELTHAAGLYHEIGKLGEESVMAAEIAREHGFPERLVQILEECGTKENQKLTSREAALVELTDGLIGTYNYLRVRSNFNTAPRKLVENAIAACITKGIMADSGITLADMSTLSAYYTEKLEEADHRKGH